MGIPPIVAPQENDKPINDRIADALPTVYVRSVRVMERHERA
jgi:hypothetical protein